jgi:hypothetical protein
VVPSRAPELVRRLPRVLVAIVLAVPVLLVAGVVLASVVLVREPVPDADTVRLAVPAVPTPAAASADCSRLLSGLDWIAVDDGLPATTTWVTTDRAVYVGLTLPDDLGTAPVQDISRGVKIALVSRSTG